MTQLSSTSSTCEAQWKMWGIKVFSVLCLTAVCAAQEDGNAVTTPQSLPPSPTPTPYEPPVPFLQPQSVWLDVFPTEKVEFSCRVNGSSDWIFTWFRNGQELLDSDPNVSLSEGGSVLTITAAQTFSGSYSCKGVHKTQGSQTGNSNSLELKVSENKPKPIVTPTTTFDKMYPGESVTFTCSVSGSTGWEYLWYHNGREIQTAQSNAYTIATIGHANSGQYHCKAKRGKGPFYTEDSEAKTLKVSDPPKPTLKLQTDWLDVFQDEVVTFTCEASGYDWTPVWYKNQEKLQLDPDGIVTADESYLNISSASINHQGSYACKLTHEVRGIISEFSDALTVKFHGEPKPTLRKDPDFNPMYVGETVNFTCNVEVSSGWEYQWYRNGEDLPDTGKTISIHLGSSDQGSYACTASRGKTETSHSEKIAQGVLEIPVPSLNRTTPWPDVFPTERVILSCGTNIGSGWTYTWFKDGVKVQADNTVTFGTNQATLSINSASPVHKGRYKCTGHLTDRSVSTHSSPELQLQVYDTKPSVVLTKDPDYKVMFPGEPVSFSCHISVSSGWEYQWYKDGRPLPESGSTYTMTSVGPTDTGSYKCQVKRGTDPGFRSDPSQSISLEVKGNKPKPLMTRVPDVDKVYAGESVFLECKVEHSSGWRYNWLKDGVQVLVDSSSFNIRASSLNSGTYECMAVRNITKSTSENSDKRILSVHEIPVPSMKMITQWPDVFPEEFVRLRCDMDGTPDWKYKWYKDGVQVDTTSSFILDGPDLSIKPASVSHRGQYNCSAEFKSRPVKSVMSSGQTLDVYDTKPSVRLAKDPDYKVMFPGEPVSFSCPINVSSGWEYQWYKDGSQLPESRSTYTIQSVLMGSTGSYKCRAKRGKSEVFHTSYSQNVELKIEERPQAHIELLTGWADVFSTDSLMLRCWVGDEDENWNYIWFREEQELNVSSTGKHSVTPQNDPDQSLYTCRGTRNVRPTFSRISDTFKTKNLLLKRRVLLSISGCIVFGIVAVMLGCIILRFVRKPGDDDDRPEEAELFLTMAQLKDRPDAPCPLVEYITDAALNAPDKEGAEGSENGAISSETTPLPITSQEDQAVTTENGDAAENNGGLVSFKS